MFKRAQLAAAASTIGLGLGVVATAALAADDDERGGQPGRGAEVEIELLERRGQKLHRAIDDHRRDELSGRYRDLYEQANELGVAPKRNLVAARREPALDVLEKGVGELRDDVEEARAAVAEGGGGSGDVGLAGGVAGSTLEAIAACESGGDPGAVNGAGYYGKYQFDVGTWQSVGGSGNPAEASEAEQDQRASMLYARTGGSAWPVCGQ